MDFVHPQHGFARLTQIPSASKLPAAIRPPSTWPAEGTVRRSWAFSGDQNRFPGGSGYAAKAGGFGRQIVAKPDKSMPRPWIPYVSPEELLKTSKRFVSRRQLIRLSEKHNMARVKCGNICHRQREQQIRPRASRSRVPALPKLEVDPAKALRYPSLRPFMLGRHENCNMFVSTTLLFFPGPHVRHDIIHESLMIMAECGFKGWVCV